MIRIHFLSPDYSDFISRLVSFGSALLNDTSSMNHVMVEVDGLFWDMTTQGICYYNPNHRGFKKVLDKRTIATVTLKEQQVNVDKLVTQHIQDLWGSNLKLDPHDYLDFLMGKREGLFSCVTFITNVLGLGLRPEDVLTPHELYRLFNSLQEIDLYGQTHTIEVNYNG